MGKVYVEYDDGVARYVCTSCHRCTSLYGTSLCKIKNRGCCFYFPEFTLVDIHRMSVTLEGLRTLEIIRRQPGAVFYSYHIHVKGYFDRQGYDEYMKKGRLLGDGSIQDHTMFFRACPFVEGGRGCTLPPRYRTIVCNFFICSEILEHPNLQAAFKPYLEERSRYARWEYREKLELQHVLMEKGLDLINNFEEAIEVLQDTPLNLYEFPPLEPVEYADGWSQGA